MRKDNSILVIGDIILDSYIYGKVKRLSPEAPCPVVDCCKAPIFKLGGAANVAFQISQSGLKVSLYGVIGEDPNGTEVKKLISENGIIDNVRLSPNTNTTIKTRYLALNHQQLLRVDNDSTCSSTIEDIEAAIRLIRSGDYSTLVISDYAKGVITSEFASKVISECKRNNIISIVDIKSNVKSKYYGASVVKGNRKEFHTLFHELGLDSDASEEYNLSKVCHALAANVVVMTCGEDGIVAYSLNDGYIKCDTNNVPVYDVTGAGDIVTAFLAILIPDSSYTFKQKIEYANIAANKKVSQVGTGCVLLDDVLNNNKITTTDIVRRLAKGKKIVFTNGCFDVLHAGHVQLLNKAKQHGDILVVGLNSDDSIKRIKGAKRPINKFDCRAEVLSSISSIDFIVKFEEDTPITLIEELNPAVLVKGGDYSEKEIVGYDYVTSHGGTVVIIPFEYNQSSTKILKSLGYE